MEYADGEMSRRGEGLGTGNDEEPFQQGRSDWGPLENDKATCKHLMEVTEVPSRVPRELDPMVLEVLGKGEGIQVEVKGNTKRWWTASMADKAKVGVGPVEEIQ